MKVLEIKKSDLEYNINLIKEMLNTSNVYSNIDYDIDSSKKELDSTKPVIIGVVKGNGYGLGLIPFSKFLVENGITRLAVSTLEEAIELKKANIEKVDILLLSASSVEAEIIEAINNNIIITIGSFDDIETLKRIITSKEEKNKILLQLKIDTGFNRYGFKKNELNKLIEELKEIENDIEIYGTFSHFSYAYSKNRENTERQFEIFKDSVKILEENDIKTGILHICNSTAFLKYPSMKLDAIRIGSAFIGRTNVKNTTLKKIGKFYSNVTEIKYVEKNETIGYSNSKKARDNMKIAIIPVGYIDGVNIGKYNDTFKIIDKIRIIKNALIDVVKDKQLYCRIKNDKCKIIGKIGMNHIAIDITGKDVNIGDKVEILNISPLNVNNKIRREYI